MIESRMNYIYEKPVWAGIIEKTKDYLYACAKNYSGLKGLLEVNYW